MKIAVSELRPTFLLIVRLVVIVTVPLLASTSHALTASADVPMRDPWVPADTRSSIATARSRPPKPKPPVLDSS